jgi:TrmH RNA methyltransferase
MSKPPSRRPPARSPRFAARSADAQLLSPREAAALPERLSDLQRVAGLPAVRALFSHRPEAVEKLFLTADLREAAAPLCQALAQRRHPFRVVAAEELAKIAGTPLHGGIVAATRPLAVARFDPLIAAGWAKDGLPLLLLDGVGNPHNLGAIARTMAFFGLRHLVLSDHPAQALPSEAALRVAEGGLDQVALYRAERFSFALKRLHEAGYRVVGTALDAQARPLGHLPRDRPLAFVLGNEELGLPPASGQACDMVVRLPGAGGVQSLNVASTAAILVWELVRAAG